MAGSSIIDRKYLKRIEALGLPTEQKPNEYLVLFMRGDGVRAPKSWNVQVFTNKVGQLRLVTNDFPTLERLLSGTPPVSEEGKRVIFIDDSGVGFPLGGVLCGAYDRQEGRLYVKEVPVEFFQPPLFQSQAYLGAYRDRALEIIGEIKPTLEGTIIKICTGFVNTKAKEALRQRNFSLVDIAHIEDPLQGRLEAAQGEYVQRITEADIYFDPKGMPKAEIARKFEEAVSYARAHNLTHLLKTGWGYFQRQTQLTLPQTKR